MCAAWQPGLTWGLSLTKAWRKPEMAPMDGWMVMPMSPVVTAQGSPVSHALRAYAYAMCRRPSPTFFLPSTGSFSLTGMHACVSLLSLLSLVQVVDGYVSI